MTSCPLVIASKVESSLPDTSQITCSATSFHRQFRDPVYCVPYLPSFRESMLCFVASRSVHQSCRQTLLDSIASVEGTLSCFAIPHGGPTRSSRSVGDSVRGGSVGNTRGMAVGMGTGVGIDVGVEVGCWMAPSDGTPLITGVATALGSALGESTSISMLGLGSCEDSGGNGSGCGSGDGVASVGRGVSRVGDWVGRGVGITSSMLMTYPMPRKWAVLSIAAAIGSSNMARKASSGYS
mmetsp:Transcript_6822/g.19729  ORF Transcript_6822/g.19729 Transcript_6822/m.19729 type:complete len:238 (+) Transcript_6822:1405-2118(+)